MTLKELRESIDGLNDNVIVYVETDHGQCAYQADCVNYTSEKDNLDYNGEEIEFEQEKQNSEDITAILIW